VPVRRAGLPTAKEHRPVHTRRRAHDLGVLPDTDPGSEGGANKPEDTGNNEPVKARRP
jgi:hypothetical protein